MSKENAAVKYSEMLLKKLRAILVTNDGAVYNNDYEGDLKSGGSVKIPTHAEAAVGDYNSATGADLSTLETAYVTMPVEWDIYVNELLDGFWDVEAIPGDVLAARIDSAAYSLANTIDIRSLAKLAAEGTVAGDTSALTKSNIFEAVIDARTALSNAKVPATDRYIIVNPTTYSLLLKSPDFVKAGDLSQTMLDKGYIGSIGGLFVKESANLGTDVAFIAGHNRCATRGIGFDVPVHVQALDGSGKYIGASAVQGRLVGGAKVTIPEGIYVRKIGA